MKTRKRPLRAGVVGPRAREMRNADQHFPEAPLRVAVALFMAAVIATPKAYADTSNDPDAADHVMAPVTVVGTRGSSYIAPTSGSTTRTDTPIKDYAGSIQVVPSEVLQDRGVTSIDQVADNVSGVHAEASYGGNGATFFNIRGFSESNGLRDGFRNYGYYAFRDVQNIDNVEIFKGPAGALYGGIGAVGGYINTVSGDEQGKRKFLS